jgi:hypothetical protein
MTATQAMPALFRRLKTVGYDEAFLRRVVLPDWWDDSLAANPVNRAQVELHVAQRLGLPLADLTTSSRPLELPGTKNIRLKRAKAGADRADVAPGMIVARNLAALVLPHLRDVPPLPANLTAATFRQSILARHRTVDLAGLLEACWTHGIAVFHFAPLPSASKKFAGMAYFEGTRPVVVLASGYDAPPRMAFYLAHEVGHILRSHVVPGGGILADSDLDGATEDEQEKEADADALEILSGRRDPKFERTYGLTAEKLRVRARLFEEQHGVHAGTVALIYGKTSKRMPVAAKALTLMNMDTGARAIVAEALRRRLLNPLEGVNPSSDMPGTVSEALPVFGVDCLA